MTLYLPSNFEVTDRAEQVRFMKANAFAMVITVVDGVPVVSHVPLLVDDDGRRLRGHFARANPHHQCLQSYPSLVVFQGPHCYVSPRWYDLPGVPTWNFMIIHANASGRILEDLESRRSVVNDLTTVYEAGRPEPWSLAELDEEFIGNNLEAIVAFELAVSSVTAKFKLSQNRTEGDRRNVRNRLEAGSAGDIAVARAMKNLDE